MEVVITRTTPVYRVAPSVGVFIQWDVNNVPVEGLKEFRIERSGAPTGPWELVVDHINTYHFFDNLRASPPPPPGRVRENLNFLSLNRDVYYRVTATAVDGTTAFDIQDLGDTLPRRQALLRRKIHRDITTGFRFNGVKMAVLKRKHWGIRCSTCFDLLTKRVTKSQCNQCYGTGFQDGYFLPVEVTGRISATMVQTDMTNEGLTDISSITVTILDYPIVEPDDIIAKFGTNQRYVVKQVTQTELRTVTVHQKIILSEMARDAPEYKLIINYGTNAIIY